MLLAGSPQQNYSCLVMRDAGIAQGSEFQLKSHVSTNSHLFPAQATVTSGCSLLLGHISNSRKALSCPQETTQSPALPGKNDIGD